MNELPVAVWDNVPEYARQEQPSNDFGEVGGLPTISPRNDGQGFNLRKDGDEQILPPQVPIVILGITPKGKGLSRCYYASGYTPGKTSPPDCQSKDGTTPDGGENIQHTDCATCPHSQWGSDPITGKGQACSQNKTMFFIIPDHDGTIFQTRISPTSLKSFAAYGKELAHHGVNMATTITIMGYEPPDPKRTYQILRFVKAQWLPKENALAAIELSQSPEIQGRITEDPTMLPAPPVRPSLPKPTPAKTPPAPAPIEEAPSAMDLAAEQAAQTFIQTQASPPLQMKLGGAGGTLPPPSSPAQSTVAVDSAGFPWDKRIHSSGKSKLKSDGTWKKLRGVSSDLVTQVQSEYLGRNVAPPQTPAAESSAIPKQSTTPTGGGSDLAATLAKWGAGA